MLSLSKHSYEVFQQNLNLDNLSSVPETNANFFSTEWSGRLPLA
jgi:hypothetical protein